MDAIGLSIPFFDLPAFNFAILFLPKSKLVALASGPGGLVGLGLLVVVNGSAEVVMNMGVDDQRGKPEGFLFLRIEARS